MSAHKRTSVVFDGNVLQEIVHRIVEVSDPEKIVLFGSRAREAHRSDSDLDLLVIKESSEPRYERAVPIYRALAGVRLGIDKDIIVRTPQEIAEWAGASLAIETIALREGKILYEKQR